MNTSLTTLREREVLIPCPDAKLHGHLSIPSGAIGLVIFAHGSGSSRFSPRNRMVASKLHERKLATLLFDLLTHAEASSDVTGARRFDIPLLSERLVAVTRWAQQHESTADLEIGYFGASTGAAAALSAAARIPQIRAMVSRGGRTDLAGDAIEGVEVPTLLIVGELDFPVIEWNEESFKRLACVKGIELVTGATHLFQEPNALEQVAELAATWFERYLPKAQKEENESHEDEFRVSQVR